jgi:hypothetical protein
MTFDDVRKVGLELPGAVESTSWGTPSLKVGKTFWLRLRPDIDALVVRIDMMDKELLINRDPDVYFSLPHYDGYPAVLVRMARIKPAELRRILAASHAHVVASRKR